MSNQRHPPSHVLVTSPTAPLWAQLERRALHPPVKDSFHPWAGPESQISQLTPARAEMTLGQLSGARLWPDLGCLCANPAIFTPKLQVVPCHLSSPSHRSSLGCWAHPRAVGYGVPPSPPTSSKVWGKTEQLQARGRRFLKVFVLSLLLRWVNVVPQKSHSPMSPLWSVRAPLG